MASPLEQDREYKELKDACDAQYRKIIGNKIPTILLDFAETFTAKDLEQNKFTCNGCRGVLDGCAYAFDLYNLNGDCLAIK